ncbi:SMI1/KNR4 family protein [Paenibacillus riograndensis]|uniref:KNR4-like cell wall assembly/cell proliferation coordinating protein n=1 Tax=Paenibacillus riograndensis SBR5 TaxID=1073571 RepID=A0A0E4HF81_9BACL|nr:SMI1/KNR4 family protein [Paenibacillus riograndensis]CQR56554.1 KNR4-like cell wall assembly/cell proliferation coordinating protein [Paenibacillus riograndensis SBR5]
MGNIAAVWPAFIQAMSEQERRFPEFLNEPATEEELLEAEQQLGFPLPEEVEELYRIHNGQNHMYGIVFGLDFLSLTELCRKWNDWKELIDSEGPEGLEELGGLCTSAPPGAIQTVYANLRWIPLFYDGSGNAVGVDLDPGEQGSMGQIINFGRDEDNKLVLAPNLAAFIPRYLTAFAGEVEIEAEDDEDDIFFSLDAHAIDVWKRKAKEGAH